MKQTQLQQLSVHVQQLAVEVGQFIRSEAGKISHQEADEKYLNNLVSYVDVTSEQRLVAALSKMLPEAGFVTEEGTVAHESDKAYQWIIDPLDGTTNFLYGIPSYAVSIALAWEGEVILGVVNEVNRYECFSAIKDGGAYLNGNKIQVSDTADLKRSLLATGFPYFKLEEVDEYLAIFKDFMYATRGLRRLGAAAVDLCYVACGKFDGYFEANLSPWDVAAGGLIVKEAGGEMSDFDGHPRNWLQAKTILASNKKLHLDMEMVIQKHWSA